MKNGQRFIFFCKKNGHFERFIFFENIDSLQMKALSNRIVLFILLFIISILAIVVPLTGYMSALKGSKKANSGLVSEFDASDPDVIDTPFILCNASISIIDSYAYSYKMHFFVAPGGSLNSTDGYRKFTQKIQFFINGILNTINPGQPSFPIVQSFVFSSGGTFNYPMITLKDTIRLNAQIRTDKGKIVSIPIAFRFQGSLHSWTFNNHIEEGQNNQILLQLEIQNSGTTIFFSVFVIVIMWMLSLSTLTIAIVVWARKKKVDAPLISVVAIVMFSLPSIRNTQPNIPIIGCTSDSIGFLFNIASMFYMRMKFKK